mmetsp:Transcript_42524/g.51641  ORF Transcript_42524/g.51641 Transcript_42524/m.51641 type:complete len:341 (-) Transcript_42524:149-1171(-)
MSRNNAEAEDRRSLRREYYNLKRNVIDNKAELLKAAGGKKLIELIDLTNQNFQNVSKPLEQVRDGEVLGLIAEIGVEKAKGAGTSSAISPTAFFSRLKLLYAPGWDVDKTARQNSETFNWKALGTSTSKFFQTAPSFTCMLGPLSTEVKQRKKVERRAKQQLAKLVNPNEVNEVGEAKQQETDRNIKEMIKVMKHNQRITMATLINNPGCFGQTTENLFTLSFLVRDGRVKLERGEDGLAVVHVPNSERERLSTQVQEGEAQSSQMIMNFSMEDWQEMQPYCGPPLIAHRTYNEEGNAIAIESDLVGTSTQAQTSTQNRRNSEREQAAADVAPKAKRRRS